MVPYWSLGFQVCRYDYPNLVEMEQVVEGVRSFGIPYDVQYGDIDYMDRQLDFTIDPISYVGLEDFVRKLQNEYEMKFMIILVQRLPTRHQLIKSFLFAQRTCFLRQVSCFWSDVLIHPPIFYKKVVDLWFLTRLFPLTNPTQPFKIGHLIHRMTVSSLKSIES